MSEYKFVGKVFSIRNRKVILVYIDENTNKPVLIVKSKQNPDKKFVIRVKKCNRPLCIIQIGKNTLLIDKENHTAFLKDCNVTVLEKCDYSIQKTE